MNELLQFCDDEREEGELMGLYGEKKKQERIKKLKMKIIKVEGEAPVEFFNWLREQVNRAREEAIAFNDKSASDLWEMLCKVNIQVKE